MSYPRKLYTLIVEDEEGPRQAYEMLFRRLREQKPGEYEQPIFALSFEDAKKFLAGPDVFHTLILDMGLPEKTRQPVPDGVEPGMELLGLAAGRDDYPIPVVLVSSARLGGKTDMPQIRARLERDFWYGQFLNKGAVNTEEEIVKGLAKAQEYCDIGVHIRDSRSLTYPTLSPREDDLLRRCILRAEYIGVDLEWWSAEDCELEPSISQWKKVLMGRFLLGKGRGTSYQTFFKFEPAENAEYVHSAAAIANSKLHHVKKIASCSSRSRSLLVTESVCASRPISLDEFLANDPAVVLPALSRIVENVVQQLEQLGASNELTRQVKEVLWPHFESETIHKAVVRWIAAQSQENVLKAFDTLSTNETSLWVKVRQCNHGDLHSKNVAIDVNANPISAFIFDPGAMTPDVNVRDLALLEVTSLLFQKPIDDGSLVEACESLYVDKVEPPPDLDFATGPYQMRNTRALIAEIHHQAARLCEPEVYALMVLDRSLMELSGLALQSKRNKIADPLDAGRLVVMSVQWLRKIAPGWF